MESITRKKGDSRMEIRVNHEDKELFELAFTLSGFKSFSEFARVTITQKAKAIIAEEQQILKTKKDKEIFFNALMGQEEPPNEALISAINSYNALLEK